MVTSDDGTTDTVTQNLIYCIILDYIADGTMPLLSNLKGTDLSPPSTLAL
jgi:hypothetical protein